MRHFKFINLYSQKTLKSPFLIKGKSICKNKDVIIRCYPAKNNFGLGFRINQGLVKANYKNFRKCDLHTTKLCHSGISVFTVEHILSAFYGMGIDNALIEMAGDNQLPLLDGSSFEYASNILKAGIKSLKFKSKVLKIVKPYVIKSKINGGFAILLPAKKFSAEIIIDFENLIGSQFFEFNSNPDFYYKSVAQARTFLIKPFAKRRWQKIRRQINTLPANPRLSNILVYNNSKFISKLRFKDEPVRHKMLDFLGDLSLLGYRILGRIIVYKPGHYFTYQLVRDIDKRVQQDN